MLIERILEGYHSFDSLVNRLSDHLPLRFSFEPERIRSNDWQRRLRTMSAVFARHTPSIRIDRLLGSGGFADVFEAESDYEGVTKFALKVLKPELLQVRKDEPRGSEEMRVKEVKQRFKNESYVQWNLSQSLSPLVANSAVKVYDHGEFDSIKGYRFILMERMESTLRDYIADKDNHRNSPLQLVYKLRLIREIAQRIDSVHKEGIFHRDIKPENILFPRTPRTGEGYERRIDVKLADFGTVRWIRSYRDSFDAVIIGSQMYMAPEQIYAPRNVDLRADIYSFGVVCYELLFGEHPMAINSNTSNLLDKLLKAEPVHREPPLGFEPLYNVVLDCMKSRERRFQTMDEVIARLDVFQNKIDS